MVASLSSTDLLFRPHLLKRGTSRGNFPRTSVKVIFYRKVKFFIAKFHYLYMEEWNEKVRMTMQQQSERSVSSESLLSKKKINVTKDQLSVKSDIFLSM